MVVKEVTKISHYFDFAEKIVRGIMLFLQQNHPDYAISLGNLAAFYSTIGNFPAAEPLYKQALEIIRLAVGEAHPGYAMSLNNLTMFYKRIGNHQAAESLLKTIN